VSEFVSGAFGANPSVFGVLRWYRNSLSDRVGANELSASPVALFLSGDVMTGRGIDQILSSPSDPILHEPCVRSALEYVAMAERND
jgi:hypothetical protein